MKRGSVTQEHPAPWTVVFTADAKSHAEYSTPLSRKVAHLARLAVDGDFNGAMEFASNVTERGVSEGGVTAESRFLLLIAPAARLLGAQWRDETYSFAEIMTGLDTIRHLVETLAAPSA